MRDLYNLENVYIIYNLLRNINEAKARIDHAVEAKDRYADLINSLLGKCIDESVQCQRIIEEALDLIQEIESGESAKADIAKWEDELVNRFGFQRTRTILIAAV